MKQAVQLARRCINLEKTSVEEKRQVERLQEELDDCKQEVGLLSSLACPRWNIHYHAVVFQKC